MPSKRPRLIGNGSSKFVRFVASNLKETLNRRFSPLIYFWGTNPQTCLFGYLQGQLSTDEMPRNKFRRQYLYVSDAQYLASNVDLSRHYASRVRPGQQQQQQQQLKRKLPSLQLDAARLQQEQPDQLNENIRLVINDMLSIRMRAEPDKSEVGEKKRTLKDMDLGSSAGSSADSGVFPNGHSSSSSSSSSASSTSSLADEPASSDSDTQSDSDHNCDKCCRARNRSAHSDTTFHSFRTHYGPGQGDDDAMPTAVIAEPDAEFGQCALDWHKDSHKLYHKNKLVALISAGMTTGSDKKYVTDTVTTLIELGYEVCVFIRRGVGGLKLSSAKFFSPAKWRDFEAAVQSVRQQRPNAHLVAVGFSFGSIELCRYLSMSGKESQVDAALLVSCPFDPEAGGRNMRKRALNRKIDAYLAKNLAKQLYQAMDVAPTSGGGEEPNPDRDEKVAGDATNRLAISNLNGSLVNLAQLPKIKSLVEFEDNYNRKLQNYPSSEAYADDSRLSEHLKFIATPTLCVSSEDDFMAPLKLLPLGQIEANDNLCMLLTKRGGHMAFIDGLIWPTRPYFAQRIIRNYMGAVKAQLTGPLAAHAHKRHLNLERRDQHQNQNHLHHPTHQGKQPAAGERKQFPQIVCASC